MERVLTSDSEGTSVLLARAAAGEEAAFTRIVAAYHTDMRRVSYVICGDLDMVDDAVQQAWSIAWRRLRSVRDSGRLRAWLVAVAANETRQLMRRRHHRPEVELDDAWLAETDFETDGAAATLDLVAAVGRMKAEDRALLALRFAAGLSATEIARVAGGTPGGIRSRLARLVGRLREELTND